MSFLEVKDRGTRFFGGLLFACTKMGRYIGSHIPLKAPLLNHSIMTRKDQEGRRSHLLDTYRRIQRQKTKGASKGPKKHKGFRVLLKKPATKTVAKSEAKRPAALPAAVAAKGETFISVMKPAAQFS